MKVINDGLSADFTSYMWVHRLDEYCKNKLVVMCEYQKTRHHRNPEEFYKGFKGILVAVGLALYHMLEDNLKGLLMPSARFMQEGISLMLSKQ